MNTILSINQLSVSLSQKVILSDINFSLNKGDILGLVGPSGCGKTTLLNTLAGFIKQSEGAIHYGKHAAITRDNFILPEHRKIGVIFQDYALFPHLTVSENIAFGIQKIPKEEQQARIEQLSKLLKIDGLLTRFPHQLSGGQQQRIAIARALAPQTELLLLDEPFSNIDARLRNELMLELRTLLKKLNITAVFVTHSKDEVFTFADKIAVLNQGKILQFGSPADVCQQPNSWQVADFLQLGSWLPVNVAKDEMQSGLGVLSTEHLNKLNVSSIGSVDKLTSPIATYLLVKPQHITNIADLPANSQINHISLTEQGYHYIVESIDKNSILHFERLSFYSESVFSLGQTLHLAIKPHSFILFVKDE